MKNLFNSIKISKPKNNYFDLTHDVKLSTNMGVLTPIMCTECVPGDKFKVGCEALIRFAPLIAPVMHRVDVTMHYFFVPNRILWANWERFITQTVDPGTGVLPVFPTIQLDSGGVNWTNLCDYFGIPNPALDIPGANAAETISALPFAAYQKIWNDYYRDQNLQDDLFPNGTVVNDGDNTSLYETTLGVIKNRAWEHDYFTASLPFAQKGAPVNIPLGDVTLKSATGTPGLFRRVDTHGLATSNVAKPDITSGELISHQTSPGDIATVYDPNGTLEAGSTTINDLRRAFRLQEWLEKNARGGTRYIEHILSHFGVRSSDKRLQRPEYITGVKSPVVISEVLNTTGPSADPLPQGNMAGHGVSMTQGTYGNYYCEEHGYIIGLMSIMPRTAYQQGIPRHFSKTDNAFQYFWPEFAHIGEQEVLNKELYAFTNTGDGTFGYVPRYAEYKFENNRVAGAFRNTLSFWHLGRIFGSQPALNDSFITSDPRFDIFAVIDPSEQQIWCQVLNKVTAMRPMPKFGTPHF